MSKFQKIFILAVFVLMGGFIASLPHFIKAQSANDLVLHFTFDNDMGDIVYDSSSYKNNGTLNGATYIDGKLGKGLLFDGVNDYVKVPSNDSLNPTDAITVQAWVYMQTETRSGKILQKKGVSGESSSGGYMLGAWFANPDGYAFEMYDVNNTQYIVRTGKDPLSGKWQYIAGTFDGINLKIYEDGILKQTSPNTATRMASSPSNLYIGIQENMLMPLAGILDEVKIYNRALNAQEICTAAGKQWNENQCVASSNLPDLIIKSITFSPEKSSYFKTDNVLIKTVIKNIGDAEAGTLELNYSDRYNDKVKTLYSYSLPAITLDPGEEYVDEISFGQWPETGVNTLEVTVDYTKKITEKNESNNTTIRSFRYDSYIPLLVIYLPAGITEFIQGQPYNITWEADADVFNQIFNLSLYKGGVFYDWIGIGVVSDSKMYEWTVSPTFPVGSDYFIRFQDPRYVDYVDTQKFSIITKLLPDLTPTLLEVKNTSRSSSEKWQAGDNIETTIAIQNIGKATAGIFNYTIDFGGSLQIESQTPNALDLQMIYKKTSSVVWTGKVHSKEMQVVLRADHTFSTGTPTKIEESNEGNNTLTKIVNTEGDTTPPTVSKVWTNKEIYYPGNQIIAYAAVDDDISGVQLITVRYESSPGRIIESTIYGLEVYQAPNIYKLTLVDAIDLRYQEANTYALNYIKLQDKAGNLVEYSNPNLPVTDSFKIEVSQPTGSPDLTVENIKTIPTNPSVGISFQIVYDLVNKGTASADFYSFSMPPLIQLDPEQDGVVLWVSDLLPKCNDDFIIDAGEHCAITQGADINKAGTFTAVVIVDPNDDLPELNETNNRISFIIDTIKKPDLIVKNIRFKRVDKQNFVVAELCNIGEGELAVSGSLMTYFENLDTKMSNYTQDGLILGPQACTDSTNEKKIFAEKLAVKSGLYKIQVTADKSDIVSETQGDNNSLTQEIYFDLEGTVQLPDLLITKFIFEPETAAMGDYLNVSYAIKNIGEVESGPFDVIMESVDERTDHVWLIKRIEESLLPGASLDRHDGIIVGATWGSYERLQAGENTVQFRVDPDQKIIEMDEGNNIITKEITVSLVAGTAKLKIDQDIIKIRSKAKLLNEDKIDIILRELHELRNLVKEQDTKIKYLTKLIAGAQNLTTKIEDRLNNFITYGVDENTKKLGAGERAAVMYSYKNAFNKLPQTDIELEDAIKIANGRWPSEKNAGAEAEAKKEFKKIYLREADMNLSVDNAAITVMSYGLRQKAENRNLNSEKAGINIFKSIYGQVPQTTEEWNILQAITYSGASR